MQNEGLGYLWHQFTWDENLPGLILFGVLAVVFALLILYWRYRQKEARLWERLGGLAVRRQLSAEELGLLETFYAALPRPNQELVLKDTKRFWQLLFRFSRAQMRTHPLEMIRLINKLFPVARFQWNITAIEDVQPGEMVAVQLAKQNLIARVALVNRDQKRMELAFADKNFEVADSISASLYFFRPGLGETRMRGSLYAASRGHALFQLEGDKIEVSGQQKLMARAELSFSMSLIAEARDEGKSETLLTGRTEYVSPRALMIQLDAPALYGTAEKKTDAWKMDLSLPDSSVRLSVTGKILPSRKEDRYLFRLNDVSPMATKILNGLVKESNPEPEKLT
ncbi:MAG TPA: hypothetical protein PKE49_12595 [Leptospiraceae bacterium]|nr:hypothetical protein [Leptospiraceae bacterium]HMX57360.1 hypothetical protein [Leptospiraceae bacterium]